MDTKVLVMFSLSEGKRLVEALSQLDGFDLRAGFWNYDELADRWNLIIATPLVNTEGTFAAYGRVIDVIREMTPPFQILEFPDVVVKSPNDPLITALREEHPHHEQGKFIRGERWGEFYIDEAYLYYVA